MLVRSPGSLASDHTREPSRLNPPGGIGPDYTREPFLLNPQGGIGLALVLGAAALYVALVAAQMNRPLMYDDANFALAARAVADTGVPYGNQGWMSERHAGVRD